MTIAASCEVVEGLRRLAERERAARQVAGRSTEFGARHYIGSGGESENAPAPTAIPTMTGDYQLTSKMPNVMTPTPWGFARSPSARRRPLGAVTMRPVRVGRLFWPADHSRQRSLASLLRRQHHRDALLPMDIAIGFEVFAKESISAAELPHEPHQREILIRLAVMWGRRRSLPSRGSGRPTGLEPLQGRPPTDETGWNWTTS